MAEAPMQEQPPAQEGGGGLEQMINNLGQGLTTLVDGLSKAGAPKEVVAPFQAALEAFTAGYEALQGGGAPQPSQPQAMEAGASGAVPAGDPRMRG